LTCLINITYLHVKGGGLLSPFVIQELQLIIIVISLAIYTIIIAPQFVKHLSYKLVLNTVVLHSHAVISDGIIYTKELVISSCITS